jgi:hypothetical protein
VNSSSRGDENVDEEGAIRCRMPPMRASTLAMGATLAMSGTAIMSGASSDPDTDRQAVIVPVGAAEGPGRWHALP